MRQPEKKSRSQTRSPWIEATQGRLPPLTLTQQQKQKNPAARQLAPERLGDPLGYLQLGEETAARQAAQLVIQEKKKRRKEM